MQRAEQLADTLGISMRTFYRRLKDGEIEGVETIAGKRYQVAADARPEPQNALIRRNPSPLVAENVELKRQVAELHEELDAIKRRLDALVEWSCVTNQRLKRAKIR